MSKYFQIFISAENRRQADTILGALLTMKLTAGGLIIHGPAKFWWKGKISDMDYYNISAFTLAKHKEAVISEVKKVSVEEVPMVWFIEFTGNIEFLKWIDENVKH